MNAIKAVSARLAALFGTPRSNPLAAAPVDHPRDVARRAAVIEALGLIEIRVQNSIGGPVMSHDLPTADPFGDYRIMINAYNASKTQAEAPVGYAYDKPAAVPVDIGEEYELHTQGAKPEAVSVDIAQDRNRDDALFDIPVVAFVGPGFGILRYRKGFPVQYLMSSNHDETAFYVWTEDATKAQGFSKRDADDMLGRWWINNRPAYTPKIAPDPEVNVGPGSTPVPMSITGNAKPSTLDVQRQLKDRELIEAGARRLIAHANTLGMVVTIETVPHKPLAMGAYEMVATVRAAR